MGALLYSAFTHHYKSQLKKPIYLEKGGGRTGMAQSKQKLNDVRQMDQFKGRNQKGTVGQGKILRSREQEAV